MATKNSIMLSCLRQLSMVYGTSVNTYAEERLYAMIDEALMSVFKDRFWDRHIKKVKVEVSNGYPTLNNLEKVCQEFDDVQVIMNNQSYPRELSRANSSVIAPVYTGTMPVFYQRSDIPSKLFRVIPPASGVDVWVIFRTLCKPEVYQDFVNNEPIIDPSDTRFTYYPSDEIPFDSLAIMYKVCYNYSMIKGDNKDQAQMYANLYSQRLSQLKESESNSTMSYETGPQQTYQNGWWSE